MGFSWQRQGLWGPLLIPMLIPSSSGDQCQHQGGILLPTKNEDWGHRPEFTLSQLCLRFPWFWAEPLPLGTGSHLLLPCLLSLTCPLPLSSPSMPQSPGHLFLLEPVSLSSSGSGPVCFWFRLPGPRLLECLYCWFILIFSSQLHLHFLSQPCHFILCHSTLFTALTTV